MATHISVNSSSTETCHNCSKITYEGFLYKGPVAEWRFICINCQGKAIEKALGIYNELEWQLYEK